MTSRLATTWRILRGLGSLAVLITLLVGTPFALWAMVGWPLPTAVPTLEALRDGLTSTHISDGTVFKVVAVIGWLAWFQVVVSVAVEATARMADRQARPRRSLPIQPVIRGLVASVALLIATSRTPAASPAQAFPTEQVMPAEPIRAITPIVPTPVRASLPADNTMPTYTVARHDTLWAIAENHLGNPFRWHEIADLNLRRPQPGGTTMVNPNLIEPGWVLTLPADAIGVASPIPPEQPPAPSPAPAPAPEPSADSPADVAPDPLPDQRPDDQTASANAEAPAPTETAVPSPQSTTAAPPQVDVGGDQSAPVSAPVITSALAAAGIVTLLELLRRARQRHRQPGRPPRQPTAANERTEHQLRVAARHNGRAETLDIALRAFAAAAKPPALSAPTILAVRSRDREVEILLDRPLQRAPAGFVDAGSGQAWRTDPKDLDDTLPQLGDDVLAPLPSLVAVGRLGDAEILIDIETAGIVTIGGDADQARGLMRSIVGQLATSFWVDYVDVLTVGEVSFDIDPGVRTRHIGTLDEAIATLDEQAVATDRALKMVDQRSTTAARLANAANDGWIPTVVVTEAIPTSEQVERLAAICLPGGRGVGAVLLTGPVDDAWTLRVEGDRLHIDPLGFDVEPNLITELGAAAIDHLLTDLRVDDDAREITEPVPAWAPVGATTEARAEPMPATELEVRVIGPVEIPGWEDRIDRRVFTEIAAYLALHPEGVDDQRLKTALWPDKERKESSFHTTVSTARHRLGKASDGTYHLLRYSDAGHCYRLGPHAGTDIAQLEDALHRAQRLPDDDAIAVLREALQLVRGIPLQMSQGYEWAYSENWVNRIENTVCDAAHLLATLCLDTHDPATARWAALQGLKTCPSSELLQRDRMLAAHQAGDPAGVEAVMRELCDAAEELEPYDAVHPETLELYERLTKRFTG